MSLCALIFASDSDSEQSLYKKYKVGLTIGVFDLIHIGHVNLFKNAKKHCNYLIVGVTSDKGVMQLKNRSPIYPEFDRRDIVNEFKSVDEVFIEEQEPGLENNISIIEKYKPDVFIKGSDYKGKADFLKQYGVDVVYLDRTEGISTTDLIKKIEGPHKKKNIIHPDEYPVFQKNLYKLMHDVDLIFQKNNIPYCSAYGTLLGSIRHHGLIPWDDDLDIMILEEDFLKNQHSIANELLHLGYNFYSNSLNKKLGECCVKVTKLVNLKELNSNTNKDFSCEMDIFVMKNDGYGNCVYRPNIYPYNVLNLEDLFPTKRHPFGPLMINVANKFQKILTQRYGEDWPYIGCKYNHQCGLDEKTAKYEELNGADYYPALKDLNLDLLKFNDFSFKDLISDVFKITKNKIINYSTKAEPVMYNQYILKNSNDNHEIDIIFTDDGQIFSNHLFSKHLHKTSLELFYFINDLTGVIDYVFPYMIELDHGYSLLGVYLKKTNYDFYMLNLKNKCMSSRHFVSSSNS
jgi:glycerol-3-phosphate cytidylyltransferase